MRSATAWSPTPSSSPSTARTSGVICRRPGRNAAQGGHVSGTVGVRAAEAVANAAGRTVARVETFVVEAGWRNFLIVKVTTSDGVVGWGDGTLGWKEFAVESLVKEFAERYLIGKDPFRIEDLWFKLYQVEHNTGPVMYSAMAGLETALWDIVGKVCGQPVVNLVGGPIRDRVRVYANGWYAAVHDH